MRSYVDEFPPFCYSRGRTFVAIHDTSLHFQPEGCVAGQMASGTQISSAPACQTVGSQIPRRQYCAGFSAPVAWPEVCNALGRGQGSGRRRCANKINNALPQERSSRCIGAGHGFFYRLRSGPFEWLATVEPPALPGDN